MRAQSLAQALSTMPGKRRRSSTAADSASALRGVVRRRNYFVDEGSGFVWL
jgi:hypothetical protein